MALRRRLEARVENRLNGSLAASPEIFSSAGAFKSRNIHGWGKREMFPIVSFLGLTDGPALAPVQPAFADDPIPSASIGFGGGAERLGDGKAPVSPRTAPNVAPISKVPCGFRPLFGASRPIRRRMRLRCRHRVPDSKTG
jgi:hypothetical protein